MVSNVKRNVLFAIPMAFVAWSLVGCQQAAQPADPNAKITDAEKKTKPTIDGQEFQGAGYTLVLPKSWKVVDFTKGTFDDAMKSLKDDPAFEKIKAGASAVQANKQVKLFAFAPEHSTPDFGANLNILEMPIPPGISASKVFEANSEQLKSVTKQDMKFAEFKAGKADAGKIEWTMPMGGKELHLTTVIAVANNNQYVFTFTMPKDKADGAKPDVEKIVQSIDFK